MSSVTLMFFSLYIHVVVLLWLFLRVDQFGVWIGRLKFHYENEICVC